MNIWKQFYATSRISCRKLCCFCGYWETVSSKNSSFEIRVHIEGVEDIQLLYLVASFVTNFEDNFDIKRNFLFNFRYEIHIFVNLISNIYINNYN